MTTTNSTTHKLRWSDFVELMDAMMGGEKEVAT